MRPLEAGDLELVIRGLGPAVLVGVHRAVKAGAWPRSLARRVAAFDMKVVVVDPRVPASERLADALPQADFVVLACALTPQTTGLMSTANLKRMKPGAFLVNVARGPVVDEQALAAALQERQLAGAGLDVLQTEPPRPENPLLARDDVVLTPHVAGHMEVLVKPLASA